MYVPLLLIQHVQGLKLETNKQIKTLVLFCFVFLFLFFVFVLFLFCLFVCLFFFFLIRLVIFVTSETCYVYAWLYLRKALHILVKEAKKDYYLRFRYQLKL